MSMSKKILLLQLKIYGQPQKKYSKYDYCSGALLAPRLSPLILHRIVRFDGFGLDDDSRVASGEGAAFGGDGSGDIAGRQS